MAKDLIVVGNWKMYKTTREASAYLEEFLPLIEGASAKVFLAVPHTSIATTATRAKGTSVTVGAQNMHDSRDGAFTGEIAALMLKEAGAEFVLLGHSERRHVFGESNEFIHRKVVRALQDDLTPILCVGETAAQRDAGQTEEVIKEQIFTCLEGVPAEESSKLILAYEPVWAIGTGKTATPELAQAVHAFCRSCLEELFGKKKGSLIPILYGGSVNGKNVAELTAQADIDGVLVGGASLEPKNFAEITLKCGQAPLVEKPKKRVSKPVVSKARAPKDSTESIEKKSKPKPKVEE
jgi:triosephosphate isomerase